jgi:hypothetical protein
LLNHPTTGNPVRWAPPKVAAPRTAQTAADKVVCAWVYPLRTW